MRKRWLLPVLALLPLLLTCRLPNLFVGPSSAAEAQLPADTIRDESRSFGGPFQYETLLPVELSLSVALYRQAGPESALETLQPQGELIIVSLENSSGERLFTGQVPAGGTLNTVLSLPAAPEDAVLTLEAPGFETRRVQIESLVMNSKVSRVMGLLAKGIAAKGETLPDRDGDGVPDIYDAYPDDPDIAFTVRNPASGSLTVAYEDLYPVPGDADYNDFVAKYFIVENHKSEVITVGEKEVIQVVLTSLHGEFKALAKVAGYNHKFGIVMEFPGHTAATVERAYIDAAGNPQTEARADVADKAVIWLFENTKNAVNKTASFDITFPDGVSRDDISQAPYDPVLCVLNTGKDIHLVGRDPLSGPVPGMTYMDPNGYPWGLLVPDDWQHPAETQYIGKAYPLFDDWRKSKGADFAYWYLYPASTSVEIGNTPPYPVTGPTNQPVLAAGDSQPQTWQLSFTDPKGDPDGDAVEFQHSPVPSVLANYFSLDAKTGTVTFQAGVPVGSYLVYFWSMDEHGATTLAKPFKVTFSFEAKVVNNPPSASFPTWAYEVENAGTAAVNGNYNRDGTYPSINPQPKFTKTDGTYKIFSFYYTADYYRYWAIDTSLTEYVDNLNTLTYFFYDPSFTNLGAPPELGWVAGTGGAEVPAVLRMPISGTTSVGKVLTVHYQFSDPDGDAQGASRFQWYRYNTVAASWEAIASATAYQYQVQNADNRQNIRVEVTPVDEHGLAGTPIVSGALLIGGTN